MKPIICIAPWLKANGMALFPFILIRDDADINNATLINHEKIHLQQQLELLILPFYFLYLLHYLINLAKFRQHDKAYREIVFEREAYDNEGDSDYLARREIWSWVNYLKLR